MNKKQETLFLITLMIIFPFSFTGCLKSEDGAAAATGNGGSCTVDTSGFITCFDYTGSGFTADVAQTACANSTVGGATGTYSASACPTADRVGSCQIYAGQATEQYIRYYTGYTSSTAEYACQYQSSGTYTAN